jgi:shikimate dehydrogenase
MHNAALAELGLDWVYVPFEVPPQKLEAALRAIPALGILGVNLTVPLKELAVPLMDDIDPTSSMIGSINTVVNNQGRLRGLSTDGPGFLWDLERKHIDPDGWTVLIWGAGGSAKAVAFALVARGCRVIIANRTSERARSLTNTLGECADWVEWGGERYEEAVRSARLLVNTTSLGMVPAHTDEMPLLPKGTLHSGQIVYDLVYAPTQTPLIRMARNARCRAFNGLGMLVCQGALSLSEWSGLPLSGIPVETMMRAASDSLRDTL